MKLSSAHIITAMVTPFDEQHHIDYQQLEQLIEYLLANGTEGLVVGGTTGEGPTLSIAEKRDLYTRTARFVHGRVPIIANTGSNNTAETIKFTHIVSQIIGIDAALVVVPPYNKPNQAGMLAHFTAIAEQGGLPVMIYNIPGRVGVKMNVSTILTLAQNPNIVAVKQCGTDEELAAIIEDAPRDFLVYTGEDAQTLTALVYGGQGVVSVASHLFGSEMAAMRTHLTTGEVAEAAQIQCRLIPKMTALFNQPSPAPVKAALNAQHHRVGTPRLPILPLSTSEQRQLLNCLA
ncbi:4-hydroxy-tetrahydrodipicolinate synthase [Lactiplantibacillus pentosus]|uniref:4-hydroxy-tetrahydrodipicolinate synthase n=1 Tax=Lactiplantibacillus pentosus TaxID=1589 RepID=A0AAW8VR43_LACPE|nr:4-hydroxy-tetrahydrodipicolinate synthase [Lactiplantibacillus pentosus]MBU7474115.1 4-hydroxy-tetrahydrodipicolinate synthase [Lactiplantibacillus pentosus]MBU7529342.1 4-hydroxy-tetrahydrodipicolinate synthase [Lactiplantibacillus pentosus]MCT3306795.1 4-hydroxy-tetrahydrodipicolinate synthase [Lactiplantibacillus pentosus]MDT6989068.1 4-hydroxy-tetrahydrodipicolinate synthase [Lactiplantibacillus pentosus]